MEGRSTKQTITLRIEIRRTWQNLCVIKYAEPERNQIRMHNQRAGSCVSCGFFADINFSPPPLQQRYC